MRVLIPLPDRDFDVTEVAVPWRVLCDAGHQVIFATERTPYPAPVARGWPLLQPITRIDGISLLIGQSMPVRELSVELSDAARRSLKRN